MWILFLRRAVLPFALLLLAAAWGCRPPVEPVFTYASGAPSRTGLVFLPTGMVLGNDFGVVTALDTTGRILWKLGVCRDLAVRPALVTDILVVACAGGDWVGVSSNDGVERWRTPIAARIAAALTSDAQHAYGVDEERGVWALDGATGAIDWTRPGDAKFGKDPGAPVAPVVWNQRVMSLSAEGALMSLDASTGTMRWRVAARGATLMTAVPDRLLLAWPNGRVNALSPEGKSLWTRELGVRLSGGPTAALGALWFGAEPNLLLAVNLEDGRERRRFPLPGPSLGHLAVADPYVVVPPAGSEGALLWFRPGDSRAAFEARVDNPLRTDARAVGDAVWVGALDGRVLALRPRR